MIKYKSSSISVKNNKDINKPNEDYFLCDDENGIYLLVDGVSRDKINGVYPNPSPAYWVSKLFVESVYGFLVSNINIKNNTIEVIYEAIKNGNGEIKKYNDKIKWDNNFLPGTVGIVAVIRNSQLFYGYIGDCYGLVINKKNKHIFTKCQTENIGKHKKEFSSIEIRNEICNNKYHPYSYGVLNGDIRAMDFVNCGSINLLDKDKILICSDGFSDVIKKLTGENMYSMTLEQMIKKSNELDDKTMIIIGEEIYDKKNR